MANSLIPGGIGQQQYVGVNSKRVDPHVFRGCSLAYPKRNGVGSSYIPLETRFSSYSPMRVAELASMKTTMNSRTMTTSIPTPTPL